MDEPAAEGETRRGRHGALLALGALVGLGVVAVLFGAFLPTRDGDPQAAAPTSRVIAGTPGGDVIPDESPTPEPMPDRGPTPTEAPAATPTASPAPTAEPTAAPTATPPPVAIATQPPVTPAPTPEPSPGIVTVGLAGPEDTVLAFYRHVEAGRFDDAYALWSDRMKATYPRADNLDERFDDTASITFQQLTIAEQAGNWATVQANFTEGYDSGSSREFIGYWELIRTRDGWLLDAPHY